MTRRVTAIYSLASVLEPAVSPFPLHRWRRMQQHWQDSVGHFQGGEGMALSPRDCGVFWPQPPTGYWFSSPPPPPPGALPPWSGGAGQFVQPLPAQPVRAPVSPRRKPLLYQKSGKWSSEEEAYADALRVYFQRGILNLPEGTTLRCFIANQLQCSPMRVSKKFGASGGLGKVVYRPRPAIELCHDEVDAARGHLLQLEAALTNREAFDQAHRMRIGVGKPCRSGDIRAPVSMSTGTAMEHPGMLLDDPRSGVTVRLVRPWQGAGGSAADLHAPWVQAWKRNAASTGVYCHPPADSAETTQEEEEEEEEDQEEEAEERVFRHDEAGFAYGVDPHREEDAQVFSAVSQV
mmetsp:Transcript_10405/g.29739  ORF Transcript_10405/g.29739 Transcript_10405/m.29739 type:complete len:348 (-) Transcript_10405:265-1308(-)